MAFPKVTDMKRLLLPVLRLLAYFSLHSILYALHPALAVAKDGFAAAGGEGVDPGEGG